MSLSVFAVFILTLGTESLYNVTKIGMIVFARAS